MGEERYIGTELEVFSHAVRWKAYVRSRIRGTLVGDVLEVGAGVGSAAKAFYDGTQRRWVCLEPDAELAKQIPREGLPRPERCEVRVGRVSDLGASEDFDAILYMDVLEHIEDDAGELREATRFLRPGGAIVVVAPALPWLYTPFDKAIGHYRRYTRKSLLAASPAGLKVERCEYLDSAGLLASAGNRLFLRAAEPGVGQILFWDRFLVPVSRVLDPILGHSAGRSLLAIWRRPS